MIYTSPLLSENNLFSAVFLAFFGSKNELCFCKADLFFYDSAIDLERSEWILVHDRRKFRHLRTKKFTAFTAR